MTGRSAPSSPLYITSAEDGSTDPASTVVRQAGGVALSSGGAALAVYLIAQGQGGQVAPLHFTIDSTPEPIVAVGNPMLDVFARTLLRGPGIEEYTGAKQLVDTTDGALPVENGLQGVFARLQALNPE